MDDLTGALRLLQETAAEAASQKAAVQFYHDPYNPRRYVQQHGAQCLDFATPPDARGHLVDTVECLVGLAQRAPKPSLWHSDCQIVLLWNDDERWDRASMTLHKTQTFKVVESLATRRLEQKDLIRLLRVELFNVVQGPALLAAARSVKFSRQEVGHADLQHGGESLGRDILRTVAGAENFPEECQLKLDVYRAINSQITVRAVVEIDVEAQRLAILPASDELAQAVHEVQQELHEHLVEKLPSTPIYFGSP